MSLTLLVGSITGSSSPVRIKVSATILESRRRHEFARQPFERRTPLPGYGGVPLSSKTPSGNWCLKNPGRNLREKVELSLVWKRVAREIADGTLGGEFDKSDRAELQSKVKDSQETAKDEVWGDYRFAVLADTEEPDGLKVIDRARGTPRAATRSPDGSLLRSSRRHSSTSSWAPVTLSATGLRCSGRPGRGHSRACDRASSTASSRDSSIPTWSCGARS